MLDLLVGEMRQRIVVGERKRSGAASRKNAHLVKGRLG